MADERFCQHFAEHANATEAYRQARYHNSTGTPQAVCMAALGRLKKPYIAARIREIRKQVLDAAQVTPARLAQSFSQQAFADRTAIFNADGSMKHPREWPMELRSIIAGIEVIPPKRPGGKPRYKVRFESGTEAKKVLASWRGMINSDSPADGPTPSRVNVINGDDEQDPGSGPGSDSSPSSGPRSDSEPSADA